MSKDILTKDWGTQKIEVVSPVDVIQMRPTELHHKSDGAKDGGSSFAIVMIAGIPGTPKIVAQISFSMLQGALGELGYTLTAPEHKVWRWWVGSGELPRYVKLNPANTVGKKVFRVLGPHPYSDILGIKVDDTTFNPDGIIAANYLLPATFEEYQEFMVGEAV